MSFVQKGKQTGSDISFKQRRESNRWKRPVDPKDALLPGVEQRPSRALASLKSAGGRVMAQALVISAFQNKPKSVWDRKEADDRPEMVLVEPDTTLDETADPVLRALRKPSSERTDDDLQTIQQATADVKFFQRLSPEEHRELCRVIQPAFAPAYTSVFEQGDVGTAVYVIYHGAAKVHVGGVHGPVYKKPTRAASWGLMKMSAQGAASPKLESVEPDVVGDESREESQEVKESEEGKARREAKENEEGMESEEGMEAKKVAKLGACVCVLEDGDSFGELALMASDRFGGIRQASVRTAMDTHLLKIDKAVYDRSLHELHEAELDRRVKFVRSIFIFGNWSEEDLRGISKVMTKRHYEKNTTIIAQGQQTDAMYLLKKGSCRVIKRMQLTQRQQGMLGHVAPPSPRSSRGRGGSGRGGGASRQPSRAPPEETLLEIGELPVRHYFGELSMLDKGPHTASVVTGDCPVEVYVLSRYDFYHLVDSGTQALMREYAKANYLDETLIRKTIHETNQWDKYRDNLADELELPRPSPRGSTTPR